MTTPTELSAESEKPSPSREAMEAAYAWLNEADFGYCHDETPSEQAEAAWNHDARSLARLLDATRLAGARAEREAVCAWLAQVCAPSNPVGVAGLLTLDEARAISRVAVSIRRGDHEAGRGEAGTPSPRPSC